MPAEYLAVSSVYAVMNREQHPKISYEFVYVKTGEVLYSNTLNTDPENETAVPETTEKTTQPITEKPTQKPTEPPTERPTKTPTEAPTEPTVAEEDWNCQEMCSQKTHKI